MTGEPLTGILLSFGADGWVSGRIVFAGGRHSSVLGRGRTPELALEAVRCLLIAKLTEKGELDDLAPPVHGGPVEEACPDCGKEHTRPPREEAH